MSDDEGAAAAAIPMGNIKVFTTSKTLRIEQFKIPEDRLQIGHAWEEWLEDFEEEISYLGISDIKDKVSAIKIYGGTEIKKLSRNLPETTPQEGDNDYTKLKRKLNNHFRPKKNKHHARYTFSKERMQADESIVRYAARMREKAKECEFGDQLNDRILEHLIQTIPNEDMIKECIRKRWNLDRFIEEAGQRDDISRQVKDMKTEHNVAKVRGKSQPRPRQRRTKGQKSKAIEKRDEKPCYYCGKTGDHKPGQNCPAYGKQCLKCGKYNHFATCCRSYSSKESTEHNKYTKAQQKQQQRVKKTTDTSDESDDGFLQQTARHLNHEAKRVRSGDKNNTVKLRIADLDADVEPDSGATINIMDEYQFRALKHRSQEILELSPSKAKLKTVQSELTVKGEFKTTVRNKTRGVIAKFLVIKGRMDSPPLICKETLIELGMLKIDPEGTLKEQNDLRIKKIKDSSYIEALLTEFRDVFQGIGCFKEKETGEKMQVKLEMDPEAKPVAQKPRNVPYHLQQPLKQWIDEGVEKEIFEKVPPNEALTWCSPLVVQPKPKFTETNKDELKSHMIRASIDMRIPNKGMKRSRCVQAPKIDDFIYHLHDCKVFSKLDLKQGYHQLSLDPETRKVATFNTPWGNYRPQRLIFSAKSSQDVFDEAMFKVFGDIPHCLNQRDDILLGGKDVEEHRQVLQTVLQRARDHGITFNGDKCEFEKEEIEFFGHIFTKDGLKPSPDKVKAVKECKAPQSKEEVRSFLGMAGYLDNFIPEYASIAAPLHRLTRKDTQFHWGKEEDDAFQKIKESLADGKTMAYFDPNKQIILRTEASYNEGLSAALLQKTDKGMQPIHYISRTMTETEKRYSQTEKDALAIKWAKDRLRVYLLGAPRFTIVTAHKPLLPLFNKVKASMPPRIEKWVMQMQDVDYELIYEPGKDEADPLDYLSRHPLPETEDDDTEKVIKWTVEAEHSVVLERIREETLQDDVMQKLAQRISRGDWDKHKRDKDMEPYIHVKQELSMAEGLIFRQERIVLPENLQRKVIKIGHSLGHLGKTKTKKMLREKYWFPYMNSMIDSVIDQCYECQVATREKQTEPIKTTTIPDRPWDTVSMDFGGPYPDGHYNLVIVDKRTRYPVAERVSSTSFRTNKERLKHVFATYETPRRVETDNGPPFNSKEFKDFAKEEGFEHHNVTPLHPRANGETERFMEMMNKTERIAHLQGKDKLESQNSIHDMLTAYRLTPHPATGVSPYEAMRGSFIRTKLDYAAPNRQLTEEDKQMNINDAKYKEKMKTQRENSRVKEKKLLIGDYVLVKQQRANKWSTPYEPIFYVVCNIEGSKITARRTTDGRTVSRDASHFKLVNSVINTANDREESVVQPRATQNIRQRDHKETPLRDAKIDDTQEHSKNNKEQMEQHNKPTETMQIKQEKQDEQREQSQHQREVSTRPRRERRLPKRFEDFQMYS